jgi:carbamoyltransferase
MGLAPYGNPESPQVQEFASIIREKLVDIKEDGSIWLDQGYFRYATGLRMVVDQKWKNLFGFARRQPEEEFSQAHCNLALAIQQVTEEVVLKMAQEAKRLTGCNQLCLAGGVALNCVANGKLESAGLFDRIWIQPAAGDAGGALGAALAAEHIFFQQDRKVVQPDAMAGSYLGPNFSDQVIERTARRYKAPFIVYSDFSKLARQVAEYLSQGAAVGWFQGRMEFGPRALGARSILGDPRNPEMQKKLNLKIKYRESFRPFAPSVLAKKANQFFDLPAISPYMLMVHPVKSDRRKPVPEHYQEMEVREKLYTLRSDIPAVTHIDFSARIQTVHAETNPRYHELLSAFDQLTGYPLLVNTSFNVRGEPIVCTPDDAYRCFMRTEMDYLVIGNYLFDKRQQPDWQSKDNWQETFKLD